MRSTFKVLFYLKRNEANKKGEVPVMCRITIDGTISQFSCKQTIDPQLWDVSAGRVSGRSDVAVAANRKLDAIRVGINKHYYDIFEREGYINAEKVKNAYLGLDQKRLTLLTIYKDFLEDFEKLYKSGSRSKATYKKYIRVYNLLEEFIKYKFNRKDIALKEIQPAFITDFDFFLRMEKGHCHNTVWVNQMPLRKMITIAVKKGWLYRDPFWEYEITNEETDRGFLTEDEIEALMNIPTFRRKKLEVVRDMFIFCCYTGLSYSDLNNLTHDNYKTAFDGHPWIITRRQKTNVSSNIWLLDIPLQIIEKYKGTTKGDKLLPVPTYDTLRTRIKDIARSCGITKDVTWHMSRHTYATQVCLNNGVSKEALQKMLGHKSITTTEIYAKILDKTVSRDMEKLSLTLQQRKTPLRLVSNM
ncbi:site-specific integrase [Parabacteroides sp. OttesenSCG-928-K15]|nr:site-specific integrase [Parabacteroides sp. OttesenSCG-928-K15]